MSDAASESATSPGDTCCAPDSPCGRRCRSITAETIYLISIGEVSLVCDQQPADAPLSAETPPLAESPVGACKPRQPDRASFDAADIYNLSRTDHPWMAAPIKKADISPTAGQIGAGQIGEPAPRQKAG